MKIEWKKYISSWYKTSETPSGNYASNLPLDSDLLEKLLDGNISEEQLYDTVNLKQQKFPNLNNNLGKINGLDILSGLQDLGKSNCITIFRAVRFPTPKRIVEMVLEKGLSLLNYEHQRLVRIYEAEDYKLKRQELMRDPKFSFIPQERIVPGLPIFFNVNDSIHIHRAYRNENDLIGLIAAYIPIDIIKTDKIEIFTNYALVQNYSDNEGDKKINHFIKLSGNGKYIPFYKALNLEGTLVYESYCNGIPESISSAEKLGIKQDFFLLETYMPEINIRKKSVNGIDISKSLINENPYFLYGFWGDDNIFMRRPSAYLPKRCYKIEKR